MVKYKLYQVGGSVRDSLLGLENKDEDFVFVIDADECILDAKEGFKLMSEWLISHGFNIFLSTPECLTIRAKFPAPKDKMVADFVLARKELGYIPNTRTPIVTVGSLEDDLERRDFTINAIAKSEEGTLIDLFEGLKDLEMGVIDTPLNPMITLIDDPLRALRAVRFKIKLGFKFSDRLWSALHHKDLAGHTVTVSTDRIRDELNKCFKYSTWETLELLKILPQPLVKEWLTRDNLWLLPTTKK